MNPATWSTTTWYLVVGTIACFAALSLWCINDAFHRNFPTVNERFAWFFVAQVPFLGPMAYLLWGRRRGQKPQG